MSGTSAAAVFVAALLTALATGLGALPLLWPRVSTRSALGIANGAASGVMLGASMGLVLEAGHRSGVRTAIGVLAGIGFVVLLSLILHAPHDGMTIGSLRGEDAVIGVGAAFAGHGLIQIARHATSKKEEPTAPKAEKKGETS